MSYLASSGICSGPFIPRHQPVQVIRDEKHQNKASPDKFLKSIHPGHQLLALRHGSGRRPHKRHICTCGTPRLYHREFARASYEITATQPFDDIPRVYRMPVYGMDLVAFCNVPAQIGRSASHDRSHLRVNTRVLSMRVAFVLSHAIMKYNGLIILGNFHVATSAKFGANRHRSPLHMICKIFLSSLGCSQKSR
jgi:hypothetical protein